MVREISLVQRREHVANVEEQEQLQAFRRLHSDSSRVQDHVQTVTEQEKLSILHAQTVTEQVV